MHLATVWFVFISLIITISLQVDKTLHKNPEEFYEEWITATDWTWLPTTQTLHKKLYQPIDSTYLETLKVNI